MQLVTRFQKLVNSSFFLAGSAFTQFNSTSMADSMYIRPIVLSGPSGGGKSTLLTRAMNEFPDTFAFTVSHTTRAPRVGEVHGRHYFFTPRAEMERMIANGEFLESAEFSGNLYGTSHKQVKDVMHSGKICVLDIELQGVRNIKNTNLDAKFILIKAPLNVLEQRLRERGTETNESIAKRLKHAEEDLRAVEADPTLFDYIVENRDLEDAYTKFVNILRDDIEKVRKLSKQLYEPAPSQAN